ncbi:activator-dependent family glycosyltransferase [Amycolatopsis sp. cmx-11-12]|uniref:activator-dependent family glycosyltransferase n=1 Tax=Amycolatopsis sp. cmx-11-12 TaxID=2785795 RepID=UPI003917F6FF
MKVLFTCFAHNTHYYPMVPLAWALRTAGHEVRVASQPDLVPTITQTGLTAVPVGPTDWSSNDPWAPDLLEMVHEEGTEHVKGFDFTGRDRAQWTWEHLLGVENVMVSALLATMNNFPMIDDLVDFAQGWQPDLVVWETFTFAGAVAAKVTGAAHARLIWGPDIALRARQEFLRQGALQAPEHREDPTGEWLETVLQRYDRHFDEELLTGQWTIDTTPRSTRLDLGLRTTGVRYVPYNGPSTVPDWLRTPPDRPRICLTLGLTAREMGHTIVSLSEVLDAMADLDVEVVATLDASQRAQVPNVPDNTRVVDFVPMNDLLPTCAAIVHQGGCGTRSTAQLHGVPQIILAYGWDTMVTAERIAALGAGFGVPAAELTAAALRAKVELLLTDPSFTLAARRLRQETLAEPSPNDFVPLLEKLTVEHR